MALDKVDVLDIVQRLQKEQPNYTPDSDLPQLIYTWDEGEHHFEAEVFPDGTVELFYRNRQTGEIWGEDTTIYKLITALARP